MFSKLIFYWVFEFRAKLQNTFQHLITHLFDMRQQSSGLDSEKI